MKQFGRVSILQEAFLNYFNSEKIMFGDPIFILSLLAVFGL